MSKKVKELTLQTIPGIVLLTTWEIAGINSNRLNFLFGRPSAIALALVEKISDRSILIDTGVTAAEAFSGFVIGTVLGSAIGLALWFSPAVAKIAKPYILGLGAIPVLALAPLVIVWFGVGLSMKIAMATIGTFFVALTQAYQGALNVDPEQIKLLRIFGAKREQIFRKVIVPSSLTWVFTSLKLNVGFALLGAFIGEFISSEQGLGHLILRAGGLYNIPLVFAGSLVLIILAFVFNWMVEWLERKRFSVIEYLSMPPTIFRSNLRKLLRG
jgi:NitT/TauT family transport system permease protein